MDRILEKVLNSYLKEIEELLGDVSFAARKEFIAEIRSHLVEKWESGECQDEENLLRVINEFGDPLEIAEDYLARSGDNPKPRGAYPPDWVVLLLTVFFWPVGIILAWISPAWKTRDKLIATLIPVLMVLLFLLIGFAINLISNRVPVERDFYQGAPPQGIMNDGGLSIKWQLNF